MNNTETLKIANKIINEYWQVIKKYEGKVLSAEKYKEISDDLDQIASKYDKGYKLLAEGISTAIYDFYESLDNTSPIGRSTHGTHSD